MDAPWIIPLLPARCVSLQVVELDIDDTLLFANVCIPWTDSSRDDTYQHLIRIGRGPRHIIENDYVRRPEMMDSSCFHGKGPRD